MHSRQVQTLLLIQVLFFSLGSKTFGTQCMDELTGAGLWEEDSASQHVHFKQLHQDSFTSFSYLQSLDGEYLLVWLEKRDFLRHDVIFAKGKHMWSSAVQNNTEVLIAELSVMWQDTVGGRQCYPGPFGAWGMGEGKGRKDLWSFLNKEAPLSLWESERNAFLFLVRMIFLFGTRQSTHVLLFCSRDRQYLRVFVESFSITVFKNWVEWMIIMIIGILLNAFLIIICE